MNVDNKELLEAMRAIVRGETAPINGRLDRVDSCLDRIEERLVRVIPQIRTVAEGHGEIIDRLKGLKDIESEQEEHDRLIWVLEQAVRAK